MQIAPKAETMEYFTRLIERELRHEGILVAEGRLLCKRLFQSSLEVLSVLATPEQEEFVQQSLREVAFNRREQILSVLTIESSAHIQQITGFPFHRGLMAAARRPSPISMSDWIAHLKTRPGEKTQTEQHLGNGGYKILIIPQMIDPGNTGTLLRSAAAFGWDAAAFGPSGTDPLSRKALRASMGAALSLPLVTATASDMKLMQNEGFFCVAAELRPGAIYIEETEQYANSSVALLIGNEYDGVPEEWHPEGCVSVSIPIADTVDSLNAAVAGSIFMYEWSKMRMNQ